MSSDLKINVKKQFLTAFIFPNSLCVDKFATKRYNINMENKEYQEMILKIMENNKGAFIGLHDCHDTNLASPILDNGLSVSRSPYSRKYDRYVQFDEHGKPNLETSYRATMHELVKNKEDSSPGAFQDIITTNPVCPIIIVIPKEIIDLSDVDVTKIDAFKPFTVLGHEEPPVPYTDEGGFEHYNRGAITPALSQEEANLKIVPTVFIAGYIDMDTGEFVKNPNYYENLPNDQKAIIKEQFEKHLRNTKNK